MSASYAITMDIRVVLVRDLDASLEENYRKKLNDNIKKALTTRIIEKVGEIEIDFGPTRVPNAYAVDISINDVLFVRELDVSLKENYRKKLNDIIKKALTARTIKKVTSIKILFKKK